METPKEGLKIPELVHKKKGTVLLLDVTIRFKVESDILQRVAVDKVEHYQPVVYHVKAMEGVEGVKVTGFPVQA